MSILVTGFDSFAEHASNPSGLVVERLGNRPDLISVVLPTSFDRAGKLVEMLLGEHAPRAVLLLGLSARARGLMLERRAKNSDDSPAVDNDGDQRSGVPIRAQGPASYPSTLPLDRLARAANESGMQSEMSDDAGGFVCNHVFYRAAHHIATSGRQTPCGFVHVPPAATPEQLAKIDACIERFIRLLAEG